MALAPDVRDRYAADRKRARTTRAAQMLRVAACEQPRRILEYALAHQQFDLASVALNFHLTVNKLYPTMGRMIKLGMVSKLHVGHCQVAYELTSEGRLVAICLRELVAGRPKRSPIEDE